jgi:hypothetical protein
LYRVGDRQASFDAVELEAVAEDRDAVGFSSGREAADGSGILGGDIDPARGRFDDEVRTFVGTEGL